MIRSVPATKLRQGDVLALPMQRTATIQDTPKVGRKFVSFKTEWGKTRLGLYEEALLEVQE